VPLYLVVGSTIAGATIYLTTNRATHPLVEGSKSQRREGLPQEHPQAPEHGQNHYESSGRQLTRSLGLHGEENKGEPGRTDGILPNMKMAKLIEGTPLDTGDAKITKPKA
jgi:hypothetical protein